VRYTDFNRRTPFVVWALVGLTFWAVVAVVALLVRG